MRQDGSKNRVSCSYVGLEHTEKGEERNKGEDRPERS
jgi:hypothetical protein